MTTTDLIHDRHARGRTQLGWLDSYHTFSFGGFRDPNRMGFRSLRVINDDLVIPGGGFATHSHRDMEILTYVLDGTLEHKDSLGNGAVIRPGEAQIMSAGTGITHSEFNHSSTEAVRFLQIWIVPNQLDLSPRYEQKQFDLAQQRGQLCLIGAKDGRDGAVTVFQDVDVYASVLSDGDAIAYTISSTRYGWVQVARGIIALNEEPLHEGDGIQLLGDRELKIEAQTGAEILLFDLA
ncbi:MAG: pirin family protein [Cyanobacteria bacterium P01_D01_bin.123]